MTDAASVAVAVASLALELEMDAELLEDVVRVREHVDEVRDRRALVAGNVGHAGLQQRLGDREDAFAAELLASAEAQQLHLFLERPLRHPWSPAGRTLAKIDRAGPIR